MAYLQMGIIGLVGLFAFGLFFAFFIDLNKDASFHNHRQKSMKPPLRVVKSQRRRSSQHERPVQRSGGQRPAPKGYREPQRQKPAPGTQRPPIRK